MSETGKLILISHELCPYVQRAVIALTEKGVEFERRDIDLSNKPAWFLARSPTGKTPLLLASGQAIFESNVILEFLEETQPGPLHPADPLERARHRAWIEFSSSILNTIAGLYNAASEPQFQAKADALRGQFQQIEDTVRPGPFFAGDSFSLVDAAFGPVFRYFDVFEEITDLGVFEGLNSVSAWRGTLARRPSVRAAVSASYPEALMGFLRRKDSVLGELARRPAAA